MKDYRNHRLSWKVRLAAVLAGGVLFGVISGIFFRNIWGCAAAVAAGTVIAPAFWRKHEQQKVQRGLRLEFPGMPIHDGSGPAHRQITGGGHRSSV